MSKTIVIVVLAALLGAVTFSLVTQNMNGWFTTAELSTPENGLPRTEKEFRDKLAEFRIDREKTLRGIVGLENRKQETIALLLKKGVANSKDLNGDLKDDTEVQFALQGLKSLVRNIDARNADVASYDETITGLVAMLADIDRQNVNDSAKMSEAQYIEGQKLIFALRDKLGVDKNDVLEDQRMRDLLDSEIAKNKSDESTESNAKNEN